MRKPIALSFLSLFVALGALANPSATQQPLMLGQTIGPAIGVPASIATTAIWSTAQTVRTLTTTSNIVSGDLVIVAVSYYTGTGASVSTVSDGTNSYSLGVSARGASGTPAAVELWYKSNASAVGSGATITLTFTSGTAGGNLAAARVTGINTSSPLDKTATDVTTTSTPTVTTAALTQTNEIAFGIQGGYNQTTYTVASGFTNIMSSNNTGQVVLGLDYKVVASTSAITYQPTSSGGGGPASMGAAVATFKGF